MQAQLRELTDAVKAIKAAPGPRPGGDGGYDGGEDETHRFYDYMYGGAEMRPPGVYVCD